MRYCDYLRATVMLLATSAVALCIVTLGLSARNDDDKLLLFSLIWWPAAVMIGLLLGRSDRTLSSIADLLSRSRPEPIFPKIEPGAILTNRHWPIFVVVGACGGLSFVIPAAPAAAAGYGFVWAFAWRKQASAVEAIEQRDGVRFWVVKTGLIERIKLVRVLGYGGIGDH